MSSQPPALDQALVNVALGKHARQSSRSPSSTQNEATGATNGRKTGKFGFHTGPDPQAWWMLDLERGFPVEHINLYNRQDAAADRASAIRVRISEDGNDWQTLVTTETLCFGGAIAGTPLSLWLGGSHFVRFLRIESLRASTPLHLDEVEVWVSRSSLAIGHLETLIDGHLDEHSEERHALRRGYTFHAADYDRCLSATDLEEFGIETIALRRFGRFGNQIIQLINGIRAALIAGAVDVYLGEVNPLGLSSSRTIAGLTFWPTSPPAERQDTLEGTFFYHRDLGRLVKGVTNVRSDLVRTYLDPLFDDVLDTITTPDASALHVHIRAGDLFAGAKVHPGYPQPPLSYYQACIEHVRSALDVREVVLVYENDANPCVGGLTAWLDAIGLPFRAQSSTFEDDIRELLSARHLIASYGTFCDTITLVSRNIEWYYAFRGRRYARELIAKGVRVFEVTDVAEPGYIKVGDWRNTPAQHAEMLSYAPDSLELDEVVES